MEQFENRLRRQPMKPLPAEWRAEILSACSGVAAERGESAAPARASSLNSAAWTWLKSIFWPHPVAWAGLAAIWIGILTVNFSTRDHAPVIAEMASPPSPEMMAELKKQRRLLAELTGATAMAEPGRREFAPRPRSECAEIYVT